MILNRQFIISHNTLNLMKESRIYQWVVNKLSKPKINPTWKMFLLGLKGQMEIKTPKPYNFYIKIMGILGTVGIAYYFLLFRKLEMDTSGHNIFIPQYIYDVREESYIYWETATNAKGMPTTFTYYKWDGDLMFEIDRSGKQTPIQTHRGLENAATFNSPFHQYNFPASPQTHSRILMYLKNMNNPYDLFNYLRAKPINMGDWLRAFYYAVYRELGLTNRWRYDEYVSKPTIYYKWEKIKLAYRLSRDRSQLYDTLDKLLPQITKQDLLTFLFWFL